jgi:hypothetical protein
VDPLSVLATWLINQIVHEAYDGVRIRLTTVIFGAPLERALVQPTADALAAAIRGQLGDQATPERERRAIDVLSTIWTSHLEVSDDSNTLLGQVQAVVARAIAIANAPVFDLPKEFQSTSSLTALSDELGVVFDADAIGESFVEAWVLAVRDGALTDPVLSELANHLAHEQTQEMVRQLPSEERVGQLIRSAIQSSINGGGGGTEWIGRERWFQVHVAPVDETMHKIYDDYSFGFSEAAKTLRSSRDLDRSHELDRAISLLNDFRRHKMSSRLDVRIVAEVLAKERARSPFSVEVQERFKGLLDAVEGFIFGADQTLYGPTATWYSYYIEEFENIMNRGENPMVRSNYGIGGDHDLRGPLAIVLANVADQRIPAKWRDYMESFTQLKLSCLSL